MDAKLHDYQIKAANFAVTHLKCGLFLDLGLGKTLITLAVLETVYDKEPGHVLIVAPKSIAKATWALEIEKWNIKLPYESLIVNKNGTNLTKEKRLEAYARIFSNPRKTVYFINREMLVDMINHCPRHGKSIVWPFQTIVIDELQSFKSPDSKRFKALKSVMPAVNRFIGLTGTPTPNSLSDIWSQIFLMDNGERLGKGITAFRQNFLQPDYINPQGMICSWRPQVGADKRVYDLISDIVISMKNTELTLPPIVFIDDYVQMSDKETKIYKQFVHDSVLRFDENIQATASNAAVMSSKLQQLASGAIYTVDADGMPTGKYQHIHDKKLERLNYIRENSDDNILIAYFFKSDADMIMKHFESKGFSCEIFDSNKSDEYLKRWNNGEIKTLLIQPSSAGFGLNFQYASHTLIWYTLPFNLENYLQTIGRVYRQGQTHPVYIHRIMTEKTIDSHVLNALTKKNREMQQLLDAVEFSNTKEASLAALNDAITASSGYGINTDDVINAINAAISDSKF